MSFAVESALVSIKSCYGARRDPKDAWRIANPMTQQTVSLRQDLVRISELTARPTIHR